MWFLLIPPIAVLLALAWFAFLNRRDRRTSEAMVTIEGYRRSMAALARPIPTGQTPARRGSGPSSTSARGGVGTGTGPGQATGARTAAARSDHRSDRR